VPIDEGARRALHRALTHPEPVIRAHAVWAARRLGAIDILTAHPELRTDPDPWVVAELAADVESRAGSSR